MMRRQRMMSSISNAPAVGINGRNEYLAMLDAAWQEHLAPRTADAPTVISLFSGIGGSLLGYSMAGFRELLAVEWWDRAAAAFRVNFSDIFMYCGDIADLSVDDCLRESGIAFGNLDVLDGSPPCQGFSMSGKRLLNDPRNRLFMEYVRLLRGLRPRAFVMENVGGMVKGKMRLVFADAMRELKASGYLVSARLMNAMWFGVPQYRSRLIFVGVRDDLGIPPSHSRAQSRPHSVAEALDLEDAAVERHPGYVDARFVAGIRRGFGDIKNEQYRNEFRGLDMPSPTLEASRPPIVAGLHTGHVIEAWERGDRYIGSYHSVRLRPDRPSPTQIAAHRNWRPDEPRQLTNDEAKRLQSFPDEFIIPPGGAGYRMIGNSVPPLFMRAIALHIRQEILDRIREAA